MVKKNCFGLLYLCGMVALVIAPAVAQDFAEHGSGGTLDETWVYLGGGLNYQDDIVVSASSGVGDGDGYILEFYDRDQSFVGIAAISSTPEVWLDLALEGWVYAYNTPQNGANVQTGLMFRMDPSSSTLYGRVFLNFADPTDKVKLQTYDGAWDNHYFNIPDASATQGWHLLRIVVGGPDHDLVTVILDGHEVITQERCPDLSPGDTLAAAGTVGLQVLHYNPSATVPCFFDGVTVNDFTRVDQWQQY